MLIFGTILWKIFRKIRFFQIDYFEGQSNKNDKKRILKKQYTVTSSIFLTDYKDLHFPPFIFYRNWSFLALFFVSRNWLPGPLKAFIVWASDLNSSSFVIHLEYILLCLVILFDHSNVSVGKLSIRHKIVNILGL